jgi:two-component system LytT family response regulator
VIRTLIVDDEAPARRRLRTLLDESPDIEIVGECGDGRSAVRAIERTRPDLVFLDVAMPELDGLGVIEAVGVSRMPPVIFVTAHDAHALRAFELHAIGYLLKPFDGERFARTLDHARRLIDRPAADELAPKLRALLDAQARERRGTDRLVVREPGRIHVVRFADIDWLEAAGNYVQLHVGRDTHLVHETMKDLAARLAPEQFRRIHRAIIVNLDRIRTIELGARGDGRVVLHDGTRLALSRSHRDQLGELLGG